MYWTRTRDGDPRAYELMTRHYSFYHYADQRRSRCTLSWASCRANTTQQYARITCATTWQARGPQPLACTRPMSAAPASALNVTCAGGVGTTAPVHATSSLEHERRWRRRAALTT